MCTCYQRHKLYLNCKTVATLDSLVVSLNRIPCRASKFKLYVYKFW